MPTGCRLLQLFPGESVGGAERYALVVATEAVRRGWEVHAAFPRREATAKLRGGFANSGVAVHALEIPDLRYRTARWLREFLPPFVRTAAICGRLKPDVAQIVLPWPDHCAGVMRATTLLGVPTVDVFQLVPEDFPVDGFRAAFVDAARRAGHRWVAVSPTARALLSRRYGVEPSTIAVIPNGVPVSGTGPDDAARAASRAAVLAEFGWTAGTTLLLTAARLDPQKGFGDLVAAVPAVLDRHPEARFLWAGGGDVAVHRDAVRRAGLDGSIVLAGHRTDVERLLAAADLFVFPTKFEGLPFALLEAMASGVPVVATAAPGVIDVVTGGEHALLANVGSAEDLAAMVNRALADRPGTAAMAHRARERVADFSAERMAERTMELLEETAACRESRKG